MRVLSSRCRGTRPPVRRQGDRRRHRPAHRPAGGHRQRLGDDPGARLGRRRAHRRPLAQEWDEGAGRPSSHLSPHAAIVTRRPTRRGRLRLVYALGVVVGPTSIEPVAWAATSVRDRHDDSALGLQVKEDRVGEPASQSTAYRIFGCPLGECSRPCRDCGDDTLDFSYKLQPQPGAAGLVPCRGTFELVQRFWEDVYAQAHEPVRRRSTFARASGHGTASAVPR